MTKSTIHQSIFSAKNTEEVIEHFFKTYYKELCQGINRMLRDRDATEDLVQEVFIKVWDRRDQLEFNDRFIYYLKRSCYHAALAYLNETKKQDPFTSESVDTNEADTPILMNELNHSIIQSINQLPPKTKLVFSLSRYEQLTYQQIADQMNVSKKAVEKHMSKALSHLRECLKDHIMDILLLITIQSFLM